MQIEKHTFIVTGGASGLGAATAELLTTLGGNVVIADMSDQGEQVAQNLGANAIFVKTNVVSATDGEDLIKATLSKFGAIHGLVNCAGVAPAEKTVGRNGPHSLASFANVININLVGTFNMLRLAADAMQKQAPTPTGERGVIINTASVAAFDGQIGQAAYAASKAGVAGMTLPIARDLSRSGIRVMAIAPGIFGTPMLLSMPEEVQQSLGQMVPFPSRLGKPAEYAALCRHIFENEMLNGEVIRLDGAVRMAPR